MFSNIKKKNTKTEKNCSFCEIQSTYKTVAYLRFVRQQIWSEATENKRKKNLKHQKESLKVKQHLLLLVIMLWQLI